ncbi:MAG: radical SAM protein [bacterium]|nr:radical SAM protein [bacterium]
MGLAYITAVLRKIGHKVLIIDAHACNLKPAEVIRRTVINSPDYVGIYSTTPQINEALLIAEGIKKQDKNIKTMLGGPHPTVLPGEVLSSKFVDIVIRGEAEQTFKELMQKPIAKVPGVSWKKNGKIIHNKDRDLIKDLDSIPFPDWDGFPIHAYRNPTKDNHPYLPIMVTRGCPYSCVFCFQNINRHRYRRRSPKNVADELDYLKNKYKIKEFVILDDNFTLDEKYALSICDEIFKRKINRPWSCAGGIRVDAAAPKLIRSMKKAGCYYLSFGVESGDQAILDSINKKIKLEQVKAAVDTAKKAGIRVTCFILIGLPGDNKGTIKRTMKFVKEVDPDLAQIGTVVPYPGTIVYENLKKENKLIYKNWSDYVRYTSRAFFETEISKEEIETLYKYAIRTFYMRPSFLIKKLFTSPGDYYRLSKAFLKHNKLLDYVLFRM